MPTVRKLRDDGTVHVVRRQPTGTPDGPADHAYESLQAALSNEAIETTERNYWTDVDSEACLVVGMTDDRVVSRLLETTETGVPDSSPEGIVYRWSSIGGGSAEETEIEPKRALIVAGTDERGLSYALYELADRVDHGGPEALEKVEDTVQFPDNTVRGIDRFVTGPVADDWLFDDDFWEYYLERLARCRFNRFVLVSGYDTSYMSPPYPFVVEIPGYPDVRLSDAVGVDRETLQERLRHIGRRCEAYGLEFVFGIWQQQPWTEVQGVLVEGVPNGEAYADYCADGLRELLGSCPEIDGVQLRVNYESGVTADGDRATAETFWNRIIDAVADASDERGEEIGLDLRAKGLTDDMIDHGLESGLDVTVPTKFWCESTGLPYHNTEMRRHELENLDDPNKSRRYSYADMLEEPRSYDILYRLWVIGTNRIFIWGDPDYARRFADATQFGDSRGFEVTAPLSLKGGHFALQEEAWPLFDDPGLRDYEWEDERYWAWYVLFGRLGYNGETDPAVWEREFRERFGEAANAIERGYRAASNVLPLLTAYHLTSHPALHTWAEFDTGGALFGEHNVNPRFGDTTYASTEPSDPGLFYGIETYVADDLEGEFAAKYTPRQIAAWLARFAEETREALEAADATDVPDSGEYRSTVLDLEMLADLAEYHARKTQAALALEYYERTDDADHLPEAHASAVVARELWQRLADHGEGTYHGNLVFGRGPANADSGTWGDKLEELDADLERLEALLEKTGVDPSVGETSEVDADAPAATAFELEIPNGYPAGDPLEIELQCHDVVDADRVQLHYRRANQLEGAFERVEMERTDRGYAATIPVSYLRPEFDLLAYVSVLEDDDGDVLLLPGIYNPDEPAPYRVIELESRDG